jgi:hypothetical protein
MLKDRRDESMSCLYGVESSVFDDDDICFGYKLDPHEVIASSSFSDGSDNEGIPCSDFPCSTQPGGKFFSVQSFLLQISQRSAAIIFNPAFRIAICVHIVLCLHNH